MESKDKLLSETQNENVNSELQSEELIENAPETVEKQEIVETVSEEIAETETPIELIVEEKTEIQEVEEIQPVVIDEEELELIAEELGEEKSPVLDVDYSSFSEIELINELKTLLESDNFLAIANQVESIKFNFYKKRKAKLQEEKENFIANGGFEEEFKPEVDPYEQDLKSLLQEYKQKKADLNKNLESDKEDNLKKKLEIIEEIKTLVNRKESINKTFLEFKELQQKWRDLGLVPQANMKDLWENYHHHVENFTII